MAKSTNSTRAAAEQERKAEQAKAEQHQRDEQAAVANRRIAKAQHK